MSLVDTLIRDSIQLTLSARNGLVIRLRVRICWQAAIAELRRPIIFHIQTMYRYAYDKQIDFQRIPLS